MNPSLLKRAAIGIAAVITIALLHAASSRILSQRDAAIEAAEHARQVTVAALDTASREVRVAAEARAQAQMALAARDSAVARADSADRRAASRRSSYIQASKAAPDTCRAVIAAADSALAAQDSVATALRGALRSSQEAVSHLGQALDTTQAALSRLQSAAVPLTHAVTTLEKASRSSFFARLIPRVGAGTAVGFDAFGKPNTVFGITFGWVF